MSSASNGMLIVSQTRNHLSNKSAPNTTYARQDNLPRALDLRELKVVLRAAGVSPDKNFLQFWLVHPIFHLSLAELLSATVGNKGIETHQNVVYTVDNHPQ